MRTPTFCYVIYSDTSRNSATGLRPGAALLSDRTIVEAAENELTRCGRSFEDLAGVALIENPDGDLVPERELSHEEIFDLSLEKLGDDGRLFIAYGTGPVGAETFLQDAGTYGLGSEARALIEKFT